MPAQSKSQQRLFGMVHAYQKSGDLPDDPTLAKKIKDIAKGITKKDAKDFASTEHKGLPNKVESVIREIIREVIKEELHDPDVLMAFVNQYLQEASYDALYEIYKILEQDIHCCLDDR